MSVHAKVYCDCVETKKINPIPVFYNNISIEPNGEPYVSDEIHKSEDYQTWYHAHPCPHRDFWLVHHRLGHILQIVFLCNMLKLFSNDPEHEYPILTLKVLTDGTHCADFLTVEEVKSLNNELESIKNKPRPSKFISKNNFKIYFHDRFNLLLKGKIPTNLTFEKWHLEMFDEFVSQMTELVKAALKVNKPIVF